jgi:trimethylamine--corrinoid protein Co-methyltransferase
MKLAALRVLSDGEIQAIHEASLEILERTGVKVGSARMFRFLREQGLPVDESRMVVRFPAARVEAAIETVPARFEVFNREGQPAFVLGDGVPRIAAGHNAVFWVDSDTGKTRPSTVADVARFARLCERLPNIDMVGIPVMPQDVPIPGNTLLHGVKACIEHSSKPIFFSTDRTRINRACIELLRAAFAGDLASQVYGISQLSPTSPLYWEEGVCEAILDTVETGIPLAILPEPNAGISAPYTLAGLLTMNNAECFSGLAMIQMLKPGAKVLYANSWTTTDMRNGYALVGSVETTACSIAGVQLARFYGVPCHTTAPNSDNHAHDEQNAWEKMLGQFCGVAAGNDLLVNCGMFATGMTCSHEQLLMDDEMSAMARRMAAGIQVDDETIAKDLICELGPANPSYLTAAHTLDWLHRDEYWFPGLAVRGPRALWEARGAKDTYRLAQDKVREYEALPQPAPLDAVRQARLDETLARLDT